MLLLNRFCRSRWLPFSFRTMSVQPSAQNGISKLRKKVTIHSLHAQRLAKVPITVLTAYDYPTAKACSSNPDVDITLVGDSLAQVCLGYDSTIQLTLSEMIHHARAVARGTTHPFLIADMPFGTYQASTTSAVTNAIRLVQEGMVDAVKMEGGSEVVQVVQRLTSMGIPVMGHVGLQPQKHVSLSGYRVQGRTAEGAKRILDDALALEAAGAFLMLIEAVPRELGAFMTEKLSIPTIGIGAGPGTSGQVLVWDDAMGKWSGHQARFVRHFAQLGREQERGVADYVTAVRVGTFPDSDHESYAMDDEEWKRFKSMF